MILFSFVNVVIEFGILLFYFRCIFDFKDSNYFFSTLWIILSIGVSTYTGILHLETQANIIISFLFYSLLGYTLFTGSIRKKFFVIIIYMVLIFFSDILAVLIISLTGISYNMVGSSNITYIVGAMLSNFIRLWLAAYTGKGLGHRMKNLPVIYWVFLVACPVLSLASLLVFDFYLMQAIDVNAFFVFIPAGCILFINLMLFYFFEAFSSQLRLKVVEELAKQERENYKVLQQTEDEIRGFKHDYRNHHLMLEEYLNKGDVKAALKYLGKIDEIFENISSVVYTSNSALDAALNIGNRKAQAEGIVYKVLIQGNDIIHIDSADIGIFLSNAIDNAIEGCSDCDEKYIYTEVCITEADLKIHIENTTKESKKKLNFITTKADKRNHGYGLKNMKSVVNKYNGDIKYNVNDNVFHLDALLNNICVK